MAEYDPDDNIYVCRCEEITLGDIKRAIAEGADSVRAIKVRTNAGMGVCQGMTCRKNIEKILRENGLQLDTCRPGSTRFPVRMVSVEELSGILEETEEGQEL